MGIFLIFLIDLIAASNGGNSSTSAALHPIYSSARTPIANYNLPSHHLQQFPYTSVCPPYQPPRNVRVASYPNPFDALLFNDNYVNQVFPPNSKPSKVTIKNNSSRGRSRTKYVSPSPYKLDNSKNNVVPPAPPPPPVIIKQEKLETPEISPKAPSSIYINPSYLAQVNSGTGELSLSIQSSSNGIRPHFNPAHSSFHLLKNSCSNNNGATVGNPGINLTNYKVVQTYHPSTSIQASTLSSYKLQQQQLKQRISSTSSASSTTSSSTNTSPLRTKYKLDRRLKRSPTRKAGKTKLFKQYSMRMVSTSKLSQSIYQSHVRKAQRQLIKKVAAKSFMKGRSKKIIVIKKGKQLTFMRNHSNF